MIVEEMERKFFELKGKLDVGVVREDEFKAQVQKLRFQDKQGRWWMLGAQSGKWYVYDGMRWIPGQPPADTTASPDTIGAEPQVVTPSAPTSPAPSTAALTSAALPPVAPTSPAPSAAAPTSAALPPVVPTPPATTEPRDTLSAEPISATREPTPAAPPPSPEHLVTAPRARPALPTLPPAHPLPISGPVLIAGAAFLALLGVIAMWIVLDNVVPGRPISAFFTSLLGAPPATVRTPTVVAGPNITPFLTQGDQLLAQSQIDVAITQYQTAAQLAPTNPAPLVRWSRALGFKGLHSDALVKAQQALQRAPDDAEVQAQLCRALAWNGQIDEAVRAGERAVQIDTRNVNARANLAEAYLLARRMVDAQGAANAALQLAPSSAEAHRAQAWVYTIQGQKENALNEWRQTVTLEPNFYFRHFEYGEVLRLYFNAPAEAVAEHEKAVSLYGAYIPAINRLGLALLAANKPQEAIAPLRRALTLDGRSEAYASLGLAFGMANQCAQAIPYLEEALRLDANNALAQSGLADCRANKPPTLPAASPPQAPLTPPLVK